MESWFGFSEGKMVPSYLPLVVSVMNFFAFHYDMVLLAPPLPQTFRALSTLARNFYVRFGKKRLLFYLDGGTVGYPAPPRLILP